MKFTRPALPLWHPATLIATWFGTGLLPKAPGTWGSLVALPIGWIILAAGGPAFLLVAVLVIFFLGWGAAALYMKGRDVGDPQEVVVDEVVGQWIVLLVADPYVWWHWTIAFALFRFFDIVKVWPANELDKRHDALGVMADDIAAAFYAAVALALAIFALHFVGGASHGS